jgi:hypothetical protein
MLANGYLHSLLSLAGDANLDLTGEGIHNKDPKPGTSCSVGDAVFLREHPLVSQ